MGFRVVSNTLHRKFGITYHHHYIREFLYTQTTSAYHFLFSSHSRTPHIVLSEIIQCMEINGSNLHLLITKLLPLIERVSKSLNQQLNQWRQNKLSTKIYFYDVSQVRELHYKHRSVTKIESCVSFYDLPWH